MISQQSIDPKAIKKIGLTSAAAMAAIVSAPVELSSQVVCGNQGTPTRTVGDCNGDMAPLALYDCARFDFDGDGIDELQIYYYNFTGYPNAYAYLDPIGVNLFTVKMASYVSFPQSPTENTTAYSTHSQDKLYLVPLSSGSGYGFIALDADAWPWLNGIDAHPTTGQPICCSNSALPIMWGGNDGLDINDLVINAASDVTDCIAPLPVKLSKFEVSAQSNSIMLSWSTESEVNNSGFEIQRSTDGVKYIDIAFIEGNENSQRTNDYAYEDMTVIKGTEYYYRLKQIDFDGKVEYSDVRFATVASDEFSFRMAPNPAQDVVNIDLSGNLNASTLDVEIYTMSGELVMNKKYEVSEVSAISIATNDMIDGMYFVKLTNDNTSKYQKLLVSK